MRGTKKRLGSITKFEAILRIQSEDDEELVEVSTVEDTLEAAQAWVLSHAIITKVTKEVIVQ